MYMTLTQIGKRYDISAIKAGKILYDLGIRDPDHPVEKGFPYEQYETHGIAKAVVDNHGTVRYYRYNLEPIREEFESLLSDVPNQPEPKKNTRSFTRYLYDELVHFSALIDALPVDPTDSAMLALKEHLETLRSKIRDEDPELSMPLDERGTLLLDSLMLWRRETARKMKLPAYAVLGNAVLHALAYYRPLDMEELTAIRGMGPKKTEAYGYELLAIFKKQEERRGE